MRIHSGLALLPSLLLLGVPLLLQALGTGPSGTSHSAVAVWRGGKLFVTESTHNLKYYGNGIMATEWSKWWATDARIDGGRS